MDNNQNKSSTPLPEEKKCPYKDCPKVHYKDCTIHGISSPKEEKCGCSICQYGGMCSIEVSKIVSSPKKPEWDEIRTSLTYCLPSGIKDFEWEVIINNVKSLLVRQREETLEKVKGIKFIMPNDADKGFFSGIGWKSQEEVTAYNSALDDIITLLKNK